jgi:hypothetical protein
MDFVLNLFACQFNALDPERMLNAHRRRSSSLWRQVSNSV